MEKIWDEIENLAMNFEACHTNYPIVWLDRQYHVEPRQMREQILCALSEMPEGIDNLILGYAAKPAGTAAPRKENYVYCI